MASAEAPAKAGRLPKSAPATARRTDPAKRDPSPRAHLQHHGVHILLVEVLVDDPVLVGQVFEADVALEDDNDVLAPWPSFGLMMRVLFLAFVSALCGIPVQGQALQGQALIDSLLRVLQGRPADTTRINTLYYLANQYYIIDPAEGLRYGFEGLELATRLGRTEDMGHMNLTLAGNYAAIDELDQALDRTLLARSQFGSANNSLGVAESLNRESSIRMKLRQWEAARTALLKYLDVSRAQGNRMNEEIAHTNLAQLEVKLKEPGSALVHLQRAYHLADSLGDTEGLAYCHSGFADVRFLLDQPVDALRHAQAALSICRGLGQEVNVASSLEQVGHALLKVHDLPPTERPDTLRDDARLLRDAERHLLEGREITTRLGRTETQMGVLRELAELRRRQGRTAESHGLLTRVIALKDSVAEIDMAERVQALERRRGEQERQEQLRAKDDEVREAQRQRSVLLAGALIVALAAAGLMLQNRRVRRARRRSDELLLNILPAATARELKGTGTTTPRQYDHTTVLFTDFVGFARVLEGHPPKEVVELIDAYFRPFDRIVQRHGLEKIKTIGDAYMAVCGVPDPRPDHAVAAVRAALEMLAFVKTEGERRAAADMPHLQIRIGLHSGPLVAGVVGETKFAFDI